MSLKFTKNLLETEGWKVVLKFLEIKKYKIWKSDKLSAHKRTGPASLSENGLFKDVTKESILLDKLSNQAFKSGIH